MTRALTRAAPLAAKWRSELRGRVARDGLRGTARSLDVPLTTLHRAVHGGTLGKLTARAIAAALVSGPPARAA